MKKLFVVLAALMLIISATAVAEELEIAGSWLAKVEEGWISLTIAEDGSGSLIDLSYGDGVAIQVTDPVTEDADYAICLASPEDVHDLLFDAENEQLVLRTGSDTQAFNKDYYDGWAILEVNPALVARYSENIYQLNITDDGVASLNYVDIVDDPAYINISYMDGISATDLAEGLVLQAGTDDVEMYTDGAFDFAADEAVIVTYNKEMDGKQFMFYFLVIVDGENSCYAVECVCPITGEEEDEVVVDSMRETMSTIAIMK